MNQLPESATAPLDATLPLWSQVLRALRLAQGATQAGWAAQIAVSRSTVQRWERGEVSPDPEMERAILEHCAGRGLLRTYDVGPLAGQHMSQEWLAQLLLEARIAGDQSPSVRAPALPAPVSTTLTARPATVSPSEPRTGAGAPLVGRARELGLLRAALAGARDSQGRTLLLGGEPGIGKTALCELLATEARALDTCVLWGRCWEGEGAPALWPWMQLIAALAGGQTSDTLRADLESGAADIAQLVPEVRALLPDVPAPPPADPEAVRFRLFGAIESLLTRLSMRRPLLLLLEDLHWADGPSVLLLRFMAQRLRGRRLLIVATYRDVEVTPGHPLADTLVALRREPAVERMAVAGLQPADVATLVTALVESELGDREQELAGSLHRGTGGNPLFIREFVRHLTETGRLVAADGAGTDAGTGALPLSLPDGVREVIGQRLARLSPSCSDVLTMAAVAGEEFALDVLARVGANRSFLPSDDALLDALDEAEAAQLVRAEGRAGRYRFAHALVREAMYTGLPAARRARLHGWVGVALEDRFAARADEHAAELAYHFGESAALAREYTRKAVSYGVRAAEQAERATAWKEAAQYYERCLTLISELGEETGVDEPELILALGRSQRNAANLRAEWLTAWQSLTRAIAAFGERGDGEGVARATLEALGVDMSPARRIALVDAALAELGDAPVLEARLLAARIADDQITEETDGLAQRASDLAERYDILDVKATIARREGTRAERRGRLEETIAGYRRAYHLFHAAGQTVYAGRVLNWAVMARIDSGDLRTGEQEAEEALTYLRSVGSGAGEDSMLVALAGIRLARRELDAFEETLRPIARDNYWPPILRARLAEQQGDLDLAARLLPELETAFGIPFSLAMMHGARARIFWRMGRLDDAQRELAGFCTTMFTEGRTLVNQTRVFAYGEIEAALAALAPADILERVYRESLGWSINRFSPWAALSFDQMWGTFALRLGLVSEAVQHYRAGLAWAEQEGCPIEVGRCLLGLAEIAARDGRLDEARGHLARALRLFEQHGAHLYREEAKRLRQSLD